MAQIMTFISCSFYIETEKMFFPPSTNGRITFFVTELESVIFICFYFMVCHFD